MFALDPLRGSTYHKLSEWIVDKKAVRNIRNVDQRCFMWSVLEALDKPRGKYSRCTSYNMYKEEYDFNCISYPPTLRKIDTFERHNTDVSINVYTIHDENDEDDDDVDMKDISEEEEEEEGEDLLHDEAIDENDEGG